MSSLIVGELRTFVLLRVLLEWASLGMGKEGLLPLPLSHRNVAPKEAFRMVHDRDRDARRCVCKCVRVCVISLHQRACVCDCNLDGASLLVSH